MKTRMAQTSLDAYYELDISPKQAEVLAELKKGDCTRQQLPAATFAHITSWSARSNQHERDAAMVAWPYRTLTLAKAERPYST